MATELPPETAALLFRLGRLSQALLELAKEARIVAEAMERLAEAEVKRPRGRSGNGGVAPV